MTGPNAGDSFSDQQTENNPLQRTNARADYNMNSQFSSLEKRLDSVFRN